MTLGDLDTAQKDDSKSADRAQDQWRISKTVKSILGRLGMLSYTKTVANETTEIMNTVSFFLGSGYRHMDLVVRTDEKEFSLSKVLGNYFGKGLIIRKTGPHTYRITRGKESN